jgi:hypothetical protein
MPHSEFRPGFRFSAFDAFLLILGALGSWFAWPRTWWAGFVIAFVVGHFFLFCNVFRISRGLELTWAAVFIILTRFTIVTEQPAWATTVLLSLAVTVLVICLECRKPSYHGIGWSRINPNLRQWWDATMARRAE